MTGLDQRLVRAGIKPGKAATKHLYEQVAAFEIDPVYIGNFQLTAGRWFERRCDVEHVIIIEIQSGDRDVRLRPGGFFLDADRSSATVELNDAVLLGRVDNVAKHRR